MTNTTQTQRGLRRLCKLASLDTGTALAAAEACRAQKLATADAIVFATARGGGEACDLRRAFKALPGVTLLETIRA